MAYTKRTADSSVTLLAPVGSGSFTSSSKTSRSGFGSIAARRLTAAVFESGPYVRIQIENVSAAFSPVGAGSFTDSSKTSRSGFGTIAVRRYTRAVYKLSDGISYAFVWECDTALSVLWISPDLPPVEWHCDMELWVDWFGIGRWRCDSKLNVYWGHDRYGMWNSNSALSCQWITTPPVIGHWRSDAALGCQWYLPPGGVNEDCLTGDGEIPGSGAGGGGTPTNYVF